MVIRGFSCRATNCQSSAMSLQPMLFCVAPCQVCSVYPTSPYQCSVLHPAMSAVFTSHHPTSVLLCTLSCLQCLPHITLPVFCVVRCHVCSVYPHTTLPVFCVVPGQECTVYPTPHSIGNKQGRYLPTEYTPLFVL